MDDVDVSVAAILGEFLGLTLHGTKPYRSKLVVRGSLRKGLKACLGSLVCLLSHYEISRTLANAYIFEAVAQFNTSVSPASKTKGPVRDVSADAAVEANVAKVTFCSVTVTEAELSVIFEYTIIDPVWLLYIWTFLIIASVASGHV